MHKLFAALLWLPTASTVYSGFVTYLAQDHGHKLAPGKQRMGLQLHSMVEFQRMYIHGCTILLRLRLHVYDWFTGFT